MDTSQGVVELETELSQWLKCLPPRHFATVAFYLDLLADRGPRLSWPYARQLDSSLRELRFHLDGRAVRITYWIGPGQKIVPLTVFMKARSKPGFELSRARKALRQCR
jgi:hypothetical protein